MAGLSRRNLRHLRPAVERERGGPLDDGRSCLSARRGEQSVPSDDRLGRHRRRDRRLAGLLEREHRHLCRACEWERDGRVDAGRRAICAAADAQTSCMIAADGSGERSSRGGDNRSGNTDIYAQRVNAGGAVQWTADGVVIRAAANIQYYPGLISNGSGGAFITWQDYRSGTSPRHLCPGGEWRRCCAVDSGRDRRPHGEVQPVLPGHVPTPRGNDHHLAGPPRGRLRRALCPAVERERGRSMDDG